MSWLDHRNNKLIAYVLTWSVILFTLTVNGQSTGDFRTIADGNWNSTSTWATYNGSSWVNASSTPTASDNVYMDRNDIVTLTADAACNDLHFERRSDGITTGSYTLSINGKLRGYNGNNPPGSDHRNLPQNDTWINTSGGGRLKFVGTTRDITASNEWDDDPYGFRVEFALDPGNTGSIRSDFSAGDIIISSGAIEVVGSVGFYANNGSSGTGSITIESGAELILNTGNVQRYENASANSDSHFGTLTVAGTLTFQNQGVELDASTFDFSGTVVYNRAADQNWASQGFSSGSAVPNTYTNVELSGSGIKTMQNNVTINGTLTMGGAATLANGGNTLSYGASGTLEYAGTSQQTTTSVEWPASSGPASAIINNSNGVVMGASRTLTGTLTFTSGMLTTTSSELLTMGSSGSVSNASASAHVSGPFAWTYATTSTTSQTFPIGDGTNYRPLGLDIAQDATTETVYTASMVAGAPTTRTLPSGLDNVSINRHYQLSKGAGANISTGAITLSYDGDDNVTDETELRIAKDDGSTNWVDQGGTGTAVTTGSITSTNNFTSLGDFVLANVGDPVVGDYRTISSGNWSNTSIWETFNGSSWVSSGGTPSSSTNVYIESGHTVTLTSTSACDDLNLNTESSTRISTSGNILEINGKIRAYSSSAPGIDALPPTSSSWINTSGGGSIRFVGTTRDLTVNGEWGGGPSGFDVDFNLTAGNTGTLNTHFRAGDITVMTGTLSLPNYYCLRVDNGSPGSGTITINASGKLLTFATRITQNGSFSDGTHIGTFTMNGEWEITGGNTLLGAASVSMDGTVKYSGVTGNSNLVNRGNLVTGTVEPHTYQSIQFLGDNRFTLPGDITVNGVMTLGMTPGVVNLENNNLTLGSSATISGTYTTDNMIATTGTGELRKIYSSSGGFVFPVGDLFGKANYTPVTVEFTSGSFGGYAGVKVTNAKAAANTNANDYIERYWDISTTITNYSVNVTMTYDDADVVGTEGSMLAARYNGSWSYGSAASTGANTALINGLSSVGVFSVKSTGPTPPPGAGGSGVPLIGEAEDVINVYPNPFAQQLVLSALTSDLVQYAIYDVSGKEILSATPIGAQAEVNTSELPAGVYLLKVTTSRKVHTRKLIKP